MKKIILILLGTNLAGMERPPALPPAKPGASQVQLLSQLQAIQREISPVLSESSLDGPVRRNSMGNISKLDCQLKILKGRLLSDKADIALETVSKTSQAQMGEQCLPIEVSYAGALAIYIEAYENNCFESLASITEVLGSLLNLEQLYHQNGLAPMGQKYAELYQKIEEICKKEQQRRKALKHKSVPISGSNEKVAENQADLHYAKAEQLLAMAQNFKANMKADDLECFNNIETLCFQAIDLFFKAYDQNKTEAYKMAEQTFEFVQSIETLKLRSHRLSYGISPEYAKACGRMREYRAKQKPQAFPEISWQEFLQLSIKEKEEKAAFHEVRIEQKVEEKDTFKKLLDRVYDKFKKHA